MARGLGGRFWRQKVTVGTKIEVNIIWKLRTIMIIILIAADKHDDHNYHILGDKFKFNHVGAADTHRDVHP